MKTFLFQGDSITDAGRSRQDEHGLGYGYPTMVAGELALRHPGAYRFLNRGISGNRIVDVYARLREDIVRLHPDYMSLLIGVNDVWHEADDGSGVSAPKFEKVYNLIISELREDLPEMKIFLIEPFVLHGNNTDPHWEAFRDEVPLRAAATRRTAEKFSLPCISVQDKLDAALSSAPADYWLVDGVHPTYAGHALIARALEDCFEQNK